MTRPEVFVRLNKVFHEVFQDSSISVHDGTTSADVRNWDSLNHITLVMAVEEEFNIRVSLGDLQDLQNVGALVDLVLNKTGTENQITA